ncbi:MAG: GDP-mannose mannosyl hydrolase [Gammaproteobacteria bacterium]|nr:GDP-mannose mannosyl hydrolase [Gammaproteobacteria bacterium]
MKLPIDTFKTIIANTPLISMDLVVYNPAGQVLLGERLNHPAQGSWFVPGGRILKDEHFDQAFKRLTQDELGVECTLQQADFLGPFEHHYPDNFTGTDFSTHYVVLGYKLLLDLSLSELPCAQHGSYQWFDPQDALASDKVHLHTKWYLE